MSWTVEVTPQFELWWDSLSEGERVSLDGVIRVLESHGATLGAPYSVETPSSRHPKLRELRVPHDGQTICVLYIADDWRSVFVLLTGATSMLDRCSPDHVALADTIYDSYLTGRRGNPH